MSIFAIGINHKTAPIELREQAYFANDKLGLYLQELLSSGHVREAVLLSTCNRSELYCETADLTAVRGWFLEQAPGAQRALESALYVYRDQDAVAHMMQVACGIDSLILGEPQILGQMKEAFSEGCGAGAVGPVFHRLFQTIFSVAKDIRTVTAIGACPVSVASAAVNFAKNCLPDLATASVALIGAGDTAQLLLRYLKNTVTQPITLLNRNIEKAQALIAACDVSATAHSLDRLTCTLARADVVFSATGSTVPLVSQAQVAEALAARHQQQLTLIDIAVPRDIAADVAELPGVRLYCVDDLKTIIESNRLGREHAAEKAREMISARAKEFFVEIKSIDKVAHTIRAYRGQIEEIARIELLKAKQQLYQGVAAEEVLEAFAHAFTQKLLHEPSVQLRQAGVEGRFELLRLAKQLFAIPDPEIERL